MPAAASRRRTGTGAASSRASSEHFGVELPDDDRRASTTPEHARARALRARRGASTRSARRSVGIELILRIFRHVYLEELDKAWVDHLTDMDHLRDGIGLRGYGQKDPKQEYKKEGYNLFVNMVAARLLQRRHQALQREREAPEEEEQIEAADLARHAGAAPPAPSRSTTSEPAPERAARRRSRPSPPSTPSRSARAAAASPSASATARRKRKKRRSDRGARRAYAQTSPPRPHGR